VNKVVWVCLQLVLILSATAALAWLFVDGGWPGMVIAAGIVIIGGWAWGRSESWQRYTHWQENSPSHWQQTHRK